MCLTRLHLAPTRYASFYQLRDGFVRALQGRLQESSGKLANKDENVGIFSYDNSSSLTGSSCIQSILDSISRLRALAPAPSMRAKTPFYVVASPEANPDTKATGTAPEEDGVRRVWLGSNFMRGYFTSDAPSKAVSFLVVCS